MVLNLKSITMYKKMFLMGALCWLALAAGAQTGTSAAAVELAQKIANKMKDSLGLTVQQQAGIYQINLQLHGQKQQARQQYSGNPAQLGPVIQAIEQSRDSLYKPLLLPQEFLVYKQKKRNLVTNN
jgi:hypothetical protein